jgi:hypothetical protein
VGGGGGVKKCFQGLRQTASADSYAFFNMAPRGTASFFYHLKILGLGQTPFQRHETCKLHKGFFANKNTLPWEIRFRDGERQQLERNFYELGRRHWLPSINIFGAAERHLFLGRGVENDNTKS